ncbi:beta strand repeat-containing protein [Lactococcus kimchii]|uniref:beta strand repeat-containing protein n=1 Tax=Lactococcus sp. S-13 TaxID=2507158 RepID=UPI001022E2D1|nr:hypothetical protein [Lactococcus sp. S-13]RZI49394.1 hypothetical protein EQJ87_08090 [Lactococcus sp. S-13]
MKQRTIKYFSLLATITLLPFANFGSVYQVFTSGKVTPTSLKQAASKISALPSALADTATSTDTTTPSTFAGKSVSAPTRPSLPTKAITDAKSNFGYQASISGLPSVTSGSVAVIAGGNTVFNATSVSDANVQAALKYITGNGSNATDYVLFVGGNVTLSATTTANSGAAGSFSGLAGHAQSLTIVSAPTDSLSSPAGSAATGASTITTPTNVYFGVPTVFRNVTFAAGGDNFYAQGNAFATVGGSWITGAPSIYGGSDTADISGDTNVYIGATGNTAGWNIYGGNSTSGTISGSTHVTVKQASSTIASISGGSAAGATINGDTNLDINGDIAAQVTNIYGAGVGTSTKPVTLKGSAITYINSTNGSARYQLYQGGAVYGNISGSIYNTFKGSGGWTGSTSNINGSTGPASTYNGGSFQGNTGTQGAGNVISNSYDTSGFTTGQALFTGNQAGTSASYSTAQNTSTAAGGVTYANITNYVKSAFSTGTAGAVYGIVGGNGHDSMKISPSQQGLGASTDTNYGPNASTAQQWGQVASNTVVAAAQQITTNAIYGNIYTWLQSGVMSTTSGGGANDWDGYAYGASSNGYLQGQSVLEAGTSNNDNSVGGAGVVYCTAMTGTAESTLAAKGTVAYGTSDVNSANSSGWDLWGGGGTVWTYRSAFLQNGDSYVVHNNDMARWTYGGQSNGNQVGNSYNILNGGIVDTLEGAGYTATTKWGSSSAQVNMGQVNWFLSGGCWGDLYQTGNAEVNVYDGYINAIAGGNYGAAGIEVISGNSTVNVYGGNFSGSPRTGTKQLSGGPFYNGNSKILGNTTLNLDLTGPTGSTFQFPSGNTALSATTGYGNSYGTVGADSSNAVNLIIKANATTASKLASATIYGDGSGRATVNAGTINITIDAPGARVGNVYASNQSMISSSKITKNINTKIGEGSTIVGDVYNSASGDDYTSAVATASTNKSTLTLGDGSAAANQPITITGRVANFTDATVNAGITAIVTGGLLNGAKATAANHAGTYAKSGTLTLNDKSTLGVTSTNSVISASKLTVNGNVNITSPYTNTVGLMNFSDLVMNGQLTWLPTGTPIAPTNSYTGAYWGTQKGYPVLTLNGGDSTTYSGAKSISNINLFKGIDEVNNYAFLGDYTTSSQSSPTNPTWIAYVVPGNIREFTIDDPEATMVGQWWHNLANVSNDATPGVARSAYSNFGAGQGSVPGSVLTIMYTQNYQPTFTTGNAKAFGFDCDDTFTGGTYVKSRVVTKYDGSVQDNYPEYSPDYDFSTGQTSGAVQKFDTSDYFTGSNKDGSYPSGAVSGSYLLTTITETSDGWVSQASNVIIHDSTYESLTEEQLDKLVGLKGTGLVPTPVDENYQPAVDGSQDGLSDGEQYRAIQLNWGGVKSTLVVVPDHANIATDGQNALDAYDAGLTYDQAKNMKNDTNTDGTGINQYTYALAIDSSGQTYTPSLTNLSTLIPDLNTVITATQFPANYTFTGTSGNGQVLKMDVALTVPAAGSLSFVSAPELMDFGTLKIKNGNLTKFSTNSNSSGTGSTLVVEDTRSGSERTGWNVTASLDNGSLSNGSNNLGKDLYFSKDGSSSVALNSQAVVIASSSDYSEYSKDISQRDQTYTLDSNWGASSKKGVYLNIPTSDQMAGNYKGTVTWTLNDTPGN